jgi:hypothetical protein
MPKYYSIHYTKVAVHGATMEYMPHYDQCDYARDVYTCEICASQVSGNHGKLSLSVLLEVSKELLTKIKYKEIEATDV